MGKSDTREAEDILVGYARDRRLEKAKANKTVAQAFIHEFGELAKSAGFDVEESDKGGLIVVAKNGSAVIDCNDDGEIGVFDYRRRDVQLIAIDWNPITGTYEGRDFEESPVQQPPHRRIRRGAAAMVAEAVVARLKKD